MFFFIHFKKVTIFCKKSHNMVSTNGIWLYLTIRPWIVTQRETLYVLCFYLVDVLDFFFQKHKYIFLHTPHVYNKFKKRIGQIHMYFIKTFFSVFLIKCMYRIEKWCTSMNSEKGIYGHLDLSPLHFQSSSMASEDIFPLRNLSISAVLRLL